MKNKKFLLVAAALLVIGAASVKPAVAYFTDTQKANGEYTISLGDSPVTPTEEVQGMTKIITVTNTGDYDVFVRVKAIHASNISDSLNSEASGWTKNGDYYYYASSLAKGEDASPLSIDINVEQEIADVDTFNVVIIEEATKAIYDAEGNPSADWSDEANKVMSREDYDAMFTKGSTENEEDNN